MPVISIRLNEQQFKEIQKKMQDEGFDNISNYVETKICSNSKDKENVLTIDEVIKRIKDKEKNSTFSIPSLFTNEEWGSYTNTVSIGRIFRLNSKKPNSRVSKYVEFVGKKKGQAAIYKVI